MVNSNCQQLTEGLESIHKLKKECDKFSNPDKHERRSKILKLRELKQSIEVVIDPLLLKLDDGTVVFYKDYNVIRDILQPNEFSVPIDNSTLATNEKGRIDYLYLHRPRKKERMNVDQLSELKELEGLDIGFQVIDNYSFLSKLTRMQFLSLYNSNFSDLNLIKDLPSLIILDLRECKNISNFQPLLELKSSSLVSIDLSGTNFPLDPNFPYIISELRAKGIEVKLNK